MALLVCESFNMYGTGDPAVITESSGLNKFYYG